MTQVLKKELKEKIKEVLANNDYQISVCIADIDSSTASFANLRGAKLSWGKSAMLVFIPGEITFLISYSDILSMSFSNDKQVNLALKGRKLVSIREVLNLRRKK